MELAASQENNKQLFEILQQHTGAFCKDLHDGIDMPTLEASPAQWLQLAEILKNNDSLQFDMLIDVCGVDYEDYGVTQWRTEDASCDGFSRASQLDQKTRVIAWDKPRFAAVYHFLSLHFNQRVRVRLLIEDKDVMTVPSVCSIWPAANWFEREAYDLFGIEFSGHPDLRRILTDYGFKGHPFRKDFPLVGEVEMRYDATLQRCVYEPVSIVPRILVPKVIRRDNRYVQDETVADDSVK
jgi:NADH-quinone oxidoreductase subunit C